MPMGGFSRLTHALFNVAVPLRLIGNHDDIKGDTIYVWSAMTPKPEHNVEWRKLMAKKRHFISAGNTEEMKAPKHFLPMSVEGGVKLLMVAWD